MPTPTCTGDSVPVVRLALSKERCARKSPTLYTNPKDIAEWVTKNYGCQPQENFLGLYFSARMELLSVQEVALGALDAAAVDSRVLFSGALLSGASALMVAHNHPSGNAEPSVQDIELTKRIAKGAQILGLRLIDHLVIARGGAYTSFIEKGFGPALEGR